MAPQAGSRNRSETHAEEEARVLVQPARKKSKQSGQNNASKVDSSTARLSINSAGSEEDDQLLSHNSTWKPVEDKPVEKKPSVLTILHGKSTGSISSEEMHDVLIRHPEIARMATDDDIINFVYKELMSFIQPLLNHTLPVINVTDPSLSQEQAYHPLVWRLWSELL